MSFQKERSVRIKAHNGRRASVVDNTIKPNQTELVDTEALIEQFRKLTEVEEMVIERLKSSGHIKRKNRII